MRLDEFLKTHRDQIDTRCVVVYVWRTIGGEEVVDCKWAKDDVLEDLDRDTNIYAKLCSMPVTETYENDGLIVRIDIY